MFILLGNVGLIGFLGSIGCVVEGTVLVFHSYTIVHLFIVDELQ